MRTLRSLLLVTLLFAGTALPALAQCAGGAGAQTGLASVSCTGVPAWSGSSSYAAGNQVVHNNCRYTANTAIGANPSWAPGTAGVYLYGNGSACPAAGCNYGADGPCGGGATPTSTATATPRPRATSTSTATATATTRSRATATATSRPRATATATTRPRATATTSGQSPYGGTNRSISNGSTIQAEDYDLGGPGVAFSDTSAGNTGASYRSDDVDIEGTTDAGGGFNVAWTVAGEWLEYTVNSTAGTYNITVRVASAVAASADFTLRLDGVVLGTFNTPNTGGWQNWQDVTISNVAITAGTNRVLRLEVVGGNDCNINYVRFATAGSTPTATATSRPTPTPTAPARSTATATATPSGGGTVWEDQFNGTGDVSTSIWVHDVGGGGWGNNELQYYQPASATNAEQGSGYLRIQVRQESVGGMAYTSGRIKTLGLKSFQQGMKVEGSMRGALGPGLWPAFWSMGTNIGSVPWPGCGEIDIMEHINTEAKTYGTIHWDSAGYVYYTAAQPTVTFTNFYTYGVEWTSDLLRWTLNGAYVGDANIAGGINGTDEFGAGKPFFVLLNFAIGGNWPGPPGAGTTLPANFDVDWVKVTSIGGAGPTPTTGPTPTAGPTPGPGCVGCTHKRLRVINGCGQPIWIQYLNGANGGSLSNPNRYQLASLNSFIEYDIPDIGIAGVRFWPGMGCDAGGHNCAIGASGGPVSMGFTCPAAGCGPPVDSKFEATFGCMSNIPSGSCQTNPSGSGVLGRFDWWNSSAVDGYTLPMRVDVVGSCPVGPVAEGPGGPPGGYTTCSSIRFADCPTNENLSTNGQFPALASVNLRLNNPATGAQAGCFSPVGKLTYSQWNPGFTTYPPDAPQAQMYACPTPPISPEQCSAGPADSTQYRNIIHAKCTNTYAYAYDDTFGLATCQAASNLRYDVTFYCPQ
jgi:beta-glucanase (GH16 family)